MGEFWRLSASPGVDPMDSQGITRPPLAVERLNEMANGHLSYRLKRPWRDGTTHVFFTPTQLIARLAALVPPPRSNTIRFHGVLAPRSRFRSGVVPKIVQAEEEVQPQGGRASRRSRYRWAQLLSRVFGVDVESCGKCGGPVKIVAAVVERSQVRRYLEHAGLPADLPKIQPARAPPEQVEMDYDAYNQDT